MDKGTLYWITGLSGAGKTSIGTELYFNMRLQKKNIVLLDGDVLKNIVGKELGYSREDRLKKGYSYSAICKLLTDQGIDVIICTIAMFDELREWNRKNIDLYVEVFLDVEMNVLKLRNKKGLYSEKMKDVVGVDIEVEYPKSPDIVIRNNGDKSIKECVQMILEYNCK